jgi:YVTN family beta-propeller protein
MPLRAVPLLRLLAVRWIPAGAALCGMLLFAPPAAAQAVIANLAAGSDPSAVVVNAATNKIYVANESSNTVTVIDGASHATASVAVGPRPQYITVNPATNRIYVSNGGDSTQSAIDGATLAVSTLATGGNGPFAVNPQTNEIYMIRLGNADEVTRINGANHTWYTMAIDSYTPRSMALNPGTNKLFVANYSTGDVRIVDLSSTSDFPPTKSIGVWARPVALALNANTNVAYVIGEEPRGPINVIDGNTQAAISFAPAGHAQLPRAIAVNPVTNKIYAAFGGEIMVMDGATNAMSFIPAGTIGAVGPVAIAVNERTNKVYVANVQGYVTVIDGTTNTYLNVAVPANAKAIALNPNTNRVYVIGPGGVTVMDGGAASTGTPVPPSPPVFSTAGMNVQGLWWRPSESGWGVNLTHQGSTVFATWFTYDADGSGMWLVMSEGKRTGENAYSGTLYRTSGPAWNGAWDASRMAYAEVGTATFSFSDSSNGTLTATVNGSSIVKSITRLMYASPATVCTVGGSAGSQPNYQDLWWRSPAGSENGWGVNITHQGDILFATWYTYGPDGKGTWLSGSSIAKTGNATYSGTLYRSWGPPYNRQPWDPALVTRMPAGNVTFSFTDASNGVMSYTVDGITQSKAITRMVYSSPTSVCR